MVQTDLMVVRIMWMIAFAAGTAYCCYITVKSVTDFFEFQVLDNNLIVNSIPIPFPAITICNVNPLNMRKIPENFREETLSRIGFDYAWPQSDVSALNILVSFACSARFLMN